MPIITITPQQWPKYMKRMGERIIAAGRRGLLSGALRCVPLMRKRTEEATPANPAGLGSGGAFNLGEYFRHWRAEATADGAMVYNDRLYAEIIEKGRRAGSRVPPRKVIAEWAMRRLGLNAKEAMQAAFPIAKAIAERGLRPRLVMTGALQQMELFVTQEVNREIAAELAKP